MNLIFSTTITRNSNSDILWRWRQKDQKFKVIFVGFIVSKLGTSLSWSEAWPEEDKKEGGKGEVEGGGEDEQEEEKEEGDD